MIRHHHVVLMSNILTRIHQRARELHHPLILIRAQKHQHRLIRARPNARVVLVDITVLIVLLPLAADLAATAIAQHPLAACLVELLIDTHTSVSKCLSFLSF
jgi:hypothetical protein